MRKLWVLPLIIFTIIVIPFSAEASFVSSLDFFGGIIYRDDEGGVEFPEFFVPDLETRTFGENEPLRGILNDDAPYAGIASIAYELQIDLPPEDQVLPWLLEFSLEIGTEEIGDFDTVIDESIPLGEFAFSDITSITEADILTFLGTIPSPISGDLGPLGFYLEGTLPGTGELYLTLSDDILPFDDIEGVFAGNISLTAIAPVPEPASLFLFGTGLLGFGFRKKK